MSKIDVVRNRYPYCLVWTPIPILSWIFPFIGHMGIATSSGIIRDFAGSKLVAEDYMVNYNNFNQRLALNFLNSNVSGF